MQVPLLDLKAQYATIKDEILPAVSDVFDSQWFIGGPTLAAFEKQVAEYSGTAEAVGVSSGTDAILCALMTLGIGAGDEVITTPFTFFATGGCIARTGAKPVFVDIDPATYNIDPAKIEAAVTPRTKVIMPVHLFGQLADMDPICQLAAKHNIQVVEDAAQAIGAKYKGKAAGNFGIAGCLSFFPSKNLGGFGDGGMILTNDADLAESLRQMRNHGAKPKYYHKRIGGNFRLDALQAAILAVKLAHLDTWSAGRVANAAKYNALFADCEAITTPFIHPDCTTIYNQYTLRVPNRDELRAHMKDVGVGCEVYYPVPLHVQECFTDLGYKAGDMPESEKAAAEVISLPIYPELVDEQIQHVTKTVLDFVTA